MSVPALPFPLLAPLSAEFEQSISMDIGTAWSVGIHGMGFLMDTLDQESPFEFRSYEKQAIPIQKPRIDDETEPGEQTLAAWWPRAQHSWHEGAGQEVFDSAFSSRFKFFNSKGWNVWTKGEMTLLKDTVEQVSHNVSDLHIIATSAALVYTQNGNLIKDIDPDTGGVVTVSTHSGTACNSLTSDGESVYAAYSGGSIGIRKIDIAAFASTVLVNSQTAVELIAFVKGRLIGAKLNALYEYNLAVTTAPEPFYTDRATTWRWTAITEAGPAIYFSGFAGDRSEIYAARLTAQDIPFASVATLGAMRSVWTAPEGETIHEIKGYVGQQLLIGTSRGVRVGTIITGEGDISVSSLVAETPSPVLCFEPQLDYAWFGWTNFDGTSTGLGRIDLGTLAYASDLMFTGQGEVLEVVQYANRLYFVIDQGTPQKIIKEHATQLVASAVLEQRDIRFGTTERKVIRFFDLLSSGTGLWSLDVAIDAGSYVAYTSDNPTGTYEEEVITLLGTKFSIKLTGKRDPGNAANGPKIQEWRLRAEPRATGKFRYMITLMLYDFLTLLNGTEYGRNGFALLQLDHLSNLFITGEDVDYQDLEYGVNGLFPVKQVIMEDLRFKTYTPPAGARGFGGLCLVILREVR